MERFKVIDVPHLEWHVTHSCNFTCQGCGHFTNDGYKENFTVDELKSWYLPWIDKIRPRELSMLGGEPLLNKDIIEIIYMTKEIWSIESDQLFELVTNALLIDKHPDLPKALSDTNCVLTITKHSDDDNYIKLFDSYIEKIKSWGVKYTIHDAVDYWLKAYVGYGPTIEPIGSDNFKESWDNCPTGQENFQLYKDKIYKCAPLAYLPLQKKKYDLSDKWEPYLKYIPLSPDGDIEKFFSRKAETVCAMCPKKSGRFKKPSPLYSPKHYGIL